MVEALEKSRVIWTELRDVSMDAYKASEMISVMLEGLKKKSTQTAAKQNSFPFPPADPSFLPQQDDNKLEQNAAMTLGMMSGGVVAPNTFDQTMGGNNSGLSAPGLDQGVLSAPSPFSMFGPGATMETPPSNLDWVRSLFSLPSP